MIDFPKEDQIPELKQLWTECFGEAGFWEEFIQKVFTADHCRCVTESGRVAAALFWLDCSLDGEKIAYLYAVATGEAYRHRGHCRRLMENTCAYLKEQDYAGAMLVPENDGLRKMYAAMGFETCTYVKEFTAEAAPEAVALRPVSAQEYGALRKSLLPNRGVVQEGKNLELLLISARLWAGEGFLLAAFPGQDTLRIWEFLGDEAAVPGALAALGCPRGIVRGPGAQKPFAMGLRLSEKMGKPDYFGLAFD